MHTLRAKVNIFNIYNLFIHQQGLGEKLAYKQRGGGEGIDLSQANNPVYLMYFTATYIQCMRRGLLSCCWLMSTHSSTILCTQCKTFNRAATTVRLHIWTEMKLGIFFQISTIYSNIKHGTFWQICTLANLQHLNCSLTWCMPRW